MEILLIPASGRRAPARRSCACIPARAPRGSGVPSWTCWRTASTSSQPICTAAARARGDRFHLVGHSYGGAIALKAALRYRGRVLSLALYEPVLFALLMREAPESAAALEIAAVRDETTNSDPAAAAERFIDYWMGRGTWAATAESRRAGLVSAVRAVTPEWHSAFYEPTPLEAFRAIEAPALLLTGTASTAAARAVARLVAGALPHVQVEELEGAGHMAPVTHPQRVNPLIERFLVGQRG